MIHISKSRGIVITSLVALVGSAIGIGVYKGYSIWVFNNSEKAKSTATVTIPDWSFGPSVPVFKNPGFYDHDGKVLVNTDNHGYKIDFKASDPETTTTGSPVGVSVASCDWNSGSGGNNFTSITFPSYEAVEVDGKIITYTVTTIGTGNRLLNFGDTMDIVIPETVTTIGANAFGNDITGVSFSGADNLVTIGANAFTGYKGSSFAFGTKLKTIGSSAFAQSAIKKIKFPDGSDIDTIGDSAFYDMESLTKVDFSNTTIGTIGSNAFSNSSSLKTVIFTDANITTIGTGAFCWDNALTKADFSNATLDTISTNAFRGDTKLTDVDIDGLKIKSIGDSAFYDTAISGTLDFRGTGLESIGSNAFYSQDNASELIIDIPSTVTSIGSQFVAGCSGKVTVNFYGITKEEAKAKFTSGYDTAWGNNTTFNYGL